MHCYVQTGIGGTGNLRSLCSQLVISIGRGKVDDLGCRRSLNVENPLM